MKIETYVKKTFTTDGMEITDEAVDRVTEEITAYVEDLTKTTLDIRSHKTLMGYDVDFALGLPRGFRKW